MDPTYVVTAAMDMSKSEGESVRKSVAGVDYCRGDSTVRAHLDTW